MTGTTSMDASYTVGQLAAAYGITVRTLHHYDEIGLVRPSERSIAGYRLYDSVDVHRLGQVVSYRRLGMPLDEIRDLLEEAGTHHERLTRHRGTVVNEIERLTRLLETIDKELESTMTDRPATTEELRQLFGEGFDDARHEAEERWGETDAWRESTQRTARLTPQQWQEIKDESSAIEKEFAQAYRASEPADSRRAMDAAEAHRRHIDARFYSCPPSMHAELGDLYVSDPRFASHYDDTWELPGLSQYVRDAIHANAARSD